MLGMHLDVNWLAIVLALIASYAFGAAWYMGLSRQWLDALGKTREQLSGGYSPFLWSAVTELVMAYFVARLIPVMTEAVTPLNGALVGAHLWLGLVLTTLILNHRYEGQKWSLTVIDGLHLLGVLVLQGLVIGAFG